MGKKKQPSVEKRMPSAEKKKPPPVVKKQPELEQGKKNHHQWITMFWKEKEVPDDYQEKEVPENI